MTVAASARPWRVLIVEDDPFVAKLHGRLVDAMSGFMAVATATNGEEARKLVATLDPDLAIVDLSMPGSDGMDFLRAIRREGQPTEVIVVTAVRDSQVVREVMQLGVVDYLVKPFAPERLQQAMTAFLARARTFRRAQLTQEEVDRVQSSVSHRAPRLPKGLRRSTLVAVRQALADAERPLTSVEVGQKIGVARVTARRYLEYLDVVGAAEVERECLGPGRPRNRYVLSSRGAHRSS